MNAALYKTHTPIHIVAYALAIRKTQQRRQEVNGGSPTNQSSDEQRQQRQGRLTKSADISAG